MPDEINSGASAESPMVVVGEPGPEVVEFEECTGCGPDGGPCPSPAPYAEEPGLLAQQLDHPALKDTGNGPTASYEEAALEALYGPADSDGVYGKGGDNA